MLPFFALKFIVNNAFPVSLDTFDIDCSVVDVFPNYGFSNIENGDLIFLDMTQASGYEGRVVRYKVIGGYDAENNFITTPPYDLGIHTLRIQYDENDGPDGAVDPVLATGYSSFIGRPSALNSIAAFNMWELYGVPSYVIAYALNTELSTKVSGGGGLGDALNPISRYQVETTSGQSVWVTSSSTFVGNVAWARSGTVLTVTKTAHGRSVGDRVILRNMNEDYLVALIASADADTFTVDCNDVGETAGTKGLYGLGFTFAHNAPSGQITGGEVYAPLNANVQLLSMRIHLAANERLTTIYNITVPASAINGAGANSGEEDLYAPICSVRQQSPGANITMTAVGFTLTKAIGGAYNTFQLAALGATTTPLNIQLSF